MSISEFLATLNSNRHNFNKHFSEEFSFFEQISKDFLEINNFLKTNYDLNKKTQVSFIQTVCLVDKYMYYGVRNLFDFLTDEAFISFRTAIESLLVWGKFADDKKNFQIWLSKATKEDPNYRKLFSGNSLISKSIENSSFLQKALAGINDQYAHPNVFFFYNSYKQEVLPNQNVTHYCPYITESDSEIRISVLVCLKICFELHKGVLSFMKSKFSQFDEKRFSLPDFNIQFFKKLPNPEDKKQKHLYKKIGQFIIE